MVGLQNAAMVGHSIFRLCLFGALGVLSAACGKNPLAPGATPERGTALTQTFERQPVANPPVSITRYEYEGKLVYFVPQRCCDISSDLYWADGTMRCHPDGGLTGSGDGLCRDFFTQRKNPQIIWQDPRDAR